MKRMVVFMAMIMLLTGCAATHEWVHPEKSRADFYSDKLECEEKANTLAYQRYPLPQAPASSMTNIVSTGENAVVTNEQGRDSDRNNYSRSSYRAEKLKECLYSKGWEWRLIEEVR